MTKRHTLNGETLTTKQWAERAGVSHKAINTRLRSGVPLQQALTLGPQPTRSKRPAFKQDRSDRTHLTADKVQRHWVATRCCEWTGEHGERLTDDEVSDIVALVAHDREVRLDLLDRGGDVAHLCMAALAQRHPSISYDAVACAA